MMRLGDTTKTLQNIAPADRSAGATNGATIDSIGFDAALFTFVVGAIGATTTFDGKLQDSDDGTTYADIPGAAITQLPATGDNQSPTIDLQLGGRKQLKRYIRAVGTVGGTNSVVYGVDCKLGGAEKAPTVSSPATVMV